MAGKDALTLEKLKIKERLSVVEATMKGFGEILGDNSEQTRKACERIKELNGFLPEMKKALDEHITESKGVRDQVIENTTKLEVESKSDANKISHDRLWRAWIVLAAGFFGLATAIIGGLFKLLPLLRELSK